MNIYRFIVILKKKITLPLNISGISAQYLTTSRLLLMCNKLTLAKLIYQLASSSRLLLKNKI